MPAPLVTLQTLQGSAFDLTKSVPVDPTKSEYWSHAGTRAAYRKLWDKINRPGGQIIWCLPHGHFFPRTGTPKTLWDLEVPDDLIVCVINDIVWHKITGRQFPQPEVEAEFDRQPHSSDLWDELFVSRKPTIPSWSVVIPFPVFQWVKKQQDWTVGRMRSPLRTA